MSIEKRGSRWVARWRDSSGAQRARSFDTKAAARVHLEEANVARRRGTDGLTIAKIKIGDLADRWLGALVHVTATTLQTYRRDLVTYVVPALGEIRADKLRPIEISTWMNDELKRLAPSSVHRHYRTLRTMLEWGVNEGYLVKNPCSIVKPPRIPRKEIRTLTISEVEGIADNISPRYRAMILVAAYGGLRWSELVGLRRRDVDGTAVIVAGQLQLINGEWVRNDPKTAAGRRRVALPPSVAAIVRDHLAEFAGPSPDDLVFTNQNGTPIGVSFRHSWNRACAAAGVGERTIKNHRPAYTGVPRFHDLRHTSVAIAIAAGAHPKAIQQRLGHSSIGVTMDRYGHLMAGMDAEIASDIEDIRAGR